MEFRVGKCSRNNASNNYSLNDTSLRRSGCDRVFKVLKGSVCLRMESLNKVLGFPF